ncbi:MAG TPA: helix-turn-helix transcriptional regulator [Bacteroidia bacterium]
MMNPNETKYIDWNALSDSNILKQLGTFVKTHRLDINLSQEELSKAAGISRSTLSLLEKGETVTLSTFIQVLRVLNQLNTLDIFKIETPISPISLLKQQKKTIQRARRIKNSSDKTTDW